MGGKYCKRSGCAGRSDESRPGSMLGQAGNAVDGGAGVVVREMEPLADGDCRCKDITGMYVYEYS